MRLTYSILALIAVLAISFLPAADSAAQTDSFLELDELEIADPGVRDTLRIDYFSAGMGGAIEAPIYFFSDEELGGMQLILSYDKLKFRCDSISFVNTTISGSRIYTIDTALGIVNTGIIVVDSIPLQPQTGVFGSMFLTQLGAPQAGPVLIDTTSLVKDSLTTLRTIFSASSPAVSIFPEYAGGVGEVLNYVLGDANNSGSINISDVTFIIAFIFVGGAAPEIPPAADPNASCTINIADATYMIAWIFSGGSAPKIGCAN